MKKEITVFQGNEIELINHNGKPFMKASDVSRALKYEREDAAYKIYERHKDEFSSDMVDTVKLGVSGNLITEALIFSLRGCHLLAMFSRTIIAKEFRKWILDILEGKIILPFGHPHPTRSFPICPAYEEHAFVSTIKTAVRDLCLTSKAWVW